MFEFLVQNKSGEAVPVTELFAVEVAKVAIAEMAIEKAVNMIAKAIAKSEFIVQRKSERVKDDIYWMLNVQPNPNETATEFWIEAIRKLLLQQECVIVHAKGELYRCSSFTQDTAVNKAKRYTNISLEAKGDTIQIEKVFKANDVIHLKNPNEKIQAYLKATSKLYDQILTGMLNAKKIISIPKFELETGAGVPILRKKDEDGKEVTLTIDEYKKEVKKMLESDNIEILINRNDLKIGQLKLETSVTMEEIAKMKKEIYTECAYAFDIPKAVFLGEITEKADSTNEFITYAVSWLVELLNDAMNATFVGKDDYKKGEYIWIDMSRYKHRDIIDSAMGLDKLRGIGFSFDEILELVGRYPLGTDFSKQRALTLNYGGEKNGKKEN